MPRQVVPLTDARCRQAKYTAGGKKKLPDGGGFFLELMKTGVRTWRIRYKQPGSGKETMLTIGDYPAVGLAEARERRAEVLALLAPAKRPAAPSGVADGLPPDCFKSVAKEWLALRKPGWSTGHHSRMEYPRFGRLNIRKVTGKMVLDAVLVVEAREALDMARRVLSAVSMVFRYAVGTGRAAADVTQGLLDFLQEKPPVQHFPHVSEAGLPALLMAVEAYHGRPETRIALKLMMRTFPRTNELRWAEWTELDIPAAVWPIPPARMKGTLVAKRTGEYHLVPLSRQAVALLEELRSLSGRYRFLFPGIRSPSTTPMSAETMNKALKIMGFEGEQTGHGFRGLASTIMNEHKVARDKAIDRQLAHVDPDNVSRAYNRAEYWEERCT